MDPQDNTFCNRYPHTIYFYLIISKPFFFVGLNFPLIKKRGLYSFLSSPLTLYPVKPLFPVLIES